MFMMFTVPAISDLKEIIFWMVSQRRKQYERYSVRKVVFVDNILLRCSDFPGGEGESKFSGRANSQDVQTPAARQALGLEPFTQNSAAAQTANAILH